MDVRCTRCGTEYEFDDALISERGTSVRCTQCGFQFKVFPPQLVAVGPDEWVVLTGLGRRVVYRSLRELQNGIAKNEVAREDLLARGSKPPRPLGSIAELDPLFTIKAAPERQPSTLTGVAPPALGSAKTGASGAEPPARPPHDTFSGVAPPANAPQEQVAVRPGAPLRVGGTGTVLGIGTAGAEPTAQNAARFRLPESAVVPPSVSVPPETRSFESMASTDVGAELSSARRDARPTGNSDAPTNRPPPSVQAQGFRTELPEVAPEPTARLPQPVAISDDGSVLADQVTVPIVVEPDLGTALAIAPIPVKLESPAIAQPTVPQAPALPDPNRQVSAPATAVVARVQLERKAVRVAAGASDAPTERWPTQADLQKSKSSSPVEGSGDVDAQPGGSIHPESTRLVDPVDLDAAVNSSTTSLPATARSREIHAVQLKTTKPAQPSLSNSEPVKSTSNRDAIATSPPTRSYRKSPPATAGANAAPSKTLASGQAVPVGATGSATQSSGGPSAAFPLGRVLTAVVLLGVGLFAGMKIVGSQLQKPTEMPSSEAPSSEAPSSEAPSSEAPNTASVETAAADWSASVEERLKSGDASGAEQLLGAVGTNEQSKPLYRALRVRTRTLAADLVWWKVQLIGKGAGDAYAQSKQLLTATLEQLKQDFASIGPESNWSEPVQAAWLDTRKMQGDKADPTDAALLERLKNPTTAELKYTQLVLSWVRAGVPDDTTVDGLKKVRPQKLDLGPHVVALVVALVQLNRFDDAKNELKGLETQTPAHPLYSEMLAYLRNAETAPAAAADTSRDATETDPDLAEGDFRLRLTRASECLSRNELTRAQKILRSVLAQRPNDTEAIAAMGDVTRRRGDMNQARTLYEKALGINGNYLPALSGAADVRWRSGDRAGAAALYRRILDRVGETPGYGQLAAARLKEIDAGIKATSGSAPAAADRDSKAIAKDKQ